MKIISWFSCGAASAIATKLAIKKYGDCVGCVKGGAGYWNKIRVDFPEVFERMSNLDRKLDRKLNIKHIDQSGERIFLDELLPGTGNYPSESMPSCGIVCSLTELENG
jgi:hypothetical protein